MARRLARPDSAGADYGAYQASGIRTFWRCQIGWKRDQRNADFSRPGYRIYFGRKAETLVILLCGGDKDSQARDIIRAHEILSNFEDD